MAVASGLVVQLIKSDRFDALLARYGIPIIPRRWFPWFALIMNLVAALTQALAAGDPLVVAVKKMCAGFLGASVPIAIHELARRDL